MKKTRRFRAIMPTFFDDSIEIKSNTDNLKVLNDLNNNEGIYLDMGEDGIIVFYDEDVWEISTNRQDYLRFKDKRGESTSITITPSFGCLNVEKNDNLFCKIEILENPELFIYYTLLNKYKNG